MNKNGSTLISFKKFASDCESEKEMLILESTVQSIAYKMYAKFSDDDYSKIIIRVESDIARPENHPIKAVSYTIEIPSHRIAYEAAISSAYLLLQYMSDASRPDLSILDYKGKEAEARI